MRNMQFSRIIPIFPVIPEPKNRRLLLRACISGVAYSALPFMPMRANATPKKVVVKFVLRLIPVVGAVVTIVEGAALAKDLWDRLYDRKDKTEDPPQQITIIINNNIDNSTKIIKIDGCIDCKACTRAMLSEDPDNLDPGDLDRLAQACPLAFVE